MNRTIGLTLALATGLAPASAPANEPAPGFARPHSVLQQVIDGMPRGEKQEVRVMTAHFRPGDRTVYHHHRFPVAVYVLEGAFTLELDGREPIVVRAGEALVEPPHVAMTGYNRSTTEPTRVVIFYVSDPATPFLDLRH